MKVDKLIKFMNNARKKCSYETIGETGERELPDGTRVIGPYNEGALSYIDTYKGFEWFKGREEVSEKGNVIWFRNYEGGVIDEIYKERKMGLVLYEVLKDALRKCPEEAPFRRGPESVKTDEYEYFDDCTGNMESFEGKEKILFQGKEIYVLEYNGGFV